MDQNEFRQRLMATFLDELEDHVRNLNQDLVVLEKGAEEEKSSRLQSLFRTAHSIKGAARAVGQKLIEAVFHHLEGFLVAVREGRRSCDTELFRMLYRAADALEQAGMNLREHQDLNEGPLADLLLDLETADHPVLQPTKMAEGLGKARSSAVARTVLSGESTGPPKPLQRSEGSAISAETETAKRPVLPDPLPSLGQPAPMGAASIRVTAQKLDTLLNRISELVVARRRLDARQEDLGHIRESLQHWQKQWHRTSKELRPFFRPGTESVPGAPVTLSHRTLEFFRDADEQLRGLDRAVERLTDSLRADSRLLDQVVSPLDEEVRRVRMLPFSQACEGLERLVRDLAQSVGKEISLVFEGGEIEVDRSILEGLKDPLRHLVRNAVDHGVELPSQRKTSGKPPGGQVRVTASLRGQQVEVTVEDDGAGLNLEGLRLEGRQAGLGEISDPAEVARLVFRPGLSTAKIVTDVSGRGVGLDVVKSRVEALHGTVDLSSRAGAGTRFTLTVPLTLTTLRAVLFKVSGQIYAFAGTNVHKLVRVAAAEFRSALGRPVLPLAGELVPVVALATVLDPKATPPPWGNGPIPLLVVAAGEQRAAFAVDEFLAEQEIVIKNLGNRLKRLHLVAGATLLPSGRIALMLSAANLIRAALKQPSGPKQGVEAATSEIPRKRLLVAEDSLTTRTLLKGILEAAGYDVQIAVDGEAAWLYLQEHPIELLVSDVEMPRLDGFALTEKIRANGRFRDLPVILVTSRESESDQLRGIEVGADAYLIKSGFDQSGLLATIAQLL